MRTKNRLVPLWKFMNSLKNINRYFKEIVKIEDESLVEIFSRSFKDKYIELKEFHYQNPNLRFSQVICTKIAYLTGSTWFIKEDHEALIELGVEPRKVLVWGQNYDKDMNRLKKTRWKIICNLETNHIESILSGNHTKDELYINAFKEELKFRKK